jgi:hypothetical protein
MRVTPARVAALAVIAACGMDQAGRQRRPPDLRPELCNRGWGASLPGARRELTGAVRRPDRDGSAGPYACH